MVNWVFVFSQDDATREFEVVVENDGIIAKQKGVNIPNTKIPFPALAERDNDDIRFGFGTRYQLHRDFIRTVLQRRRRSSCNL